MMELSLYFMFIIWFLMMLTLITIGVLVAKDANKYGENGLLWAIIVVIMPMMGLFLYLIFRSTWNNLNQIKNNDKLDFIYCTTCGFENNTKSLFCTNCGQKITN
jgi:hypothetical protein